MPTLAKINGKWTEGTPYLKEGGTWKEVGAVTARLNGKWADVAPPKPAGKHWTADDFGELNYGVMARYTILPSNPQYFTIGDTVDIASKTSGRPFTIFRPQDVDAVPPGLIIKEGRVFGTIEGPPKQANHFGAELTGTSRPRFALFLTNDGQYIPIKPAP